MIEMREIVQCSSVEKTSVTGDQELLNSMESVLQKTERNPGRNKAEPLNSTHSSYTPEISLSKVYGGTSNKNMSNFLISLVLTIN
jgi:hypothetical protein